MQLIYKRLGNYIREINIRNRGLVDYPLLGVSIQKILMSSIANTIGTDMSTYKLIKKNQFAYGPVTSRNGDKISIAILEKHENALLSQAYTVFEVLNESELNPDYLMMWFKRSEFDRYARFMSHGSAREIFSWSEMCDTLLPIPSPEKQLEFVKEYNVIQNRIKLNNQLIAKLEDTAQTIYKQWFIDFEFPNKNGLPYKSSGGEMIKSEFGEIPKGWSASKLSEIADSQYGYTASADYLIEGPKFLRITDISNDNINWNSVPNCEITKRDFDKYVLEAGDIVIARTGATVGFAKQINKLSPPAVFASYLVRLKIRNKKLFRYVGLSVVSQNYRDYILNVAGGSAQPQANAVLMIDFNIILPMEAIIDEVNKLINPIFDFQEILQMENSKILELRGLILAKMTKVEPEKELA
jgi:type I restriction enzyme S subunit